MKRKLTSIAFGISVLFLVSCNDNADGRAGSDTTAGATMTADTTNASTTTDLNTAPLSREDSSFVMEAAIGGLTEVESGKVAQENGMSERVKSYGQMMVTDHGRANDELMSIVSGRGFSLPTSLPADKQQHIDAMKKMKGKSFDNHFVNMMVNDHQKTIDLFQKQSRDGNDAQLKSWAANTLPVLQKHMDSAQAMKKGIN